MHKSLKMKLLLQQPADPKIPGFAAVPHLPSSPLKVEARYGSDFFVKVSVKIFVLTKNRVILMKTNRQLPFFNTMFLCLCGYET